MHGSGCRRLEHHWPGLRGKPSSSRIAQQMMTVYTRSTILRCLGLGVQAERLAPMMHTRSTVGRLAMYRPWRAGYQTPLQPPAAATLNSTSSCCGGLSASNAASGVC
ncbi:hypothetical protein Salat_1697300 [Sesamum alatum]|uniref:Uncharacterized protein n=1 Tax=Sesamum alatum TaxID=300844 RepID=A0AAE1Y7Y8_9LAMI|nr:hypothetical protein Salat_1697300 [Sesamum alatum]